jgi:hypothetical protein
LSFFSKKISTYITAQGPAMLYFINDLLDPLTSYVKDDPVRPEIPLDFRIADNAEIIVLLGSEKPTAIVCVAYRDFVPKDTVELVSPPYEPSVAVFYTIWSYIPGAGRDLIVQARKELTKRKPNIKKFVTLSPQTEMARKFHLKNGATIFSENANSVNYEYA